MYFVFARRGVAWFGVVVVMWGSVRCGGWNGGHEESEEAPRLFFYVVVFSTLQKETFSSYLNDLIQCMLFSSSPLLAGGASRSTEGNLIEWFTHWSSGQWFNPIFHQLSDAHCYIEEGNAAPHKWRREATYHHPKGERDESTATQKIEGEKHHHPNGGGDKAAPPTQGRKNSTSPKGDGATFGFVLLSPSLLLCGGVFSSPSSGWRCFFSLSFGVMLLLHLSSSSWVVVLFSLPYIAWCCVPTSFFDVVQYVLLD